MTFALSNIQVFCIHIKQLHANNIYNKCLSYLKIKHYEKTEKNRILRIRATSQKALIQGRFVLQANKEIIIFKSYVKSIVYPKC